MVTVNTLQKTRAKGEKITTLTAYESNSAALTDNAGVDVSLVGDSLGIAVQGRQSTLPVSLQGICYRTECVTCGTKNAMIVSDLPSGTYQQSKKQAFVAVIELMAADVRTVKLEGSAWMVETTESLQVHGILICAHTGLTSQSVFTLGDYKAQGRGDKAEASLSDAKAHDVADAAIVLVECVSAELAKEVTEMISCSTIGIDADVDCDGQVLVMHDMLDTLSGKIVRFVKSFMQGRDSAQAAIKAYANEAKTKTLPSVEHTFAG